MSIHRARQLANARRIRTAFSGSRWHDSVRNLRLNTTTTFQDIIQTTRQSREGIQYKVTPRVTRETIGSKVLSRDIIPYMRKRNIEITTHRMKPRTCLLYTSPSPRD